LSTSSVSRTTVSIPRLGEPQTGARFPSHPSLSHSGADGSLLVWFNIHKELAFIQLSREVSVKTVRQPLLLPFVSPLLYLSTHLPASQPVLYEPPIHFLNSTFEFIFSYTIPCLGANPSFKQLKPPRQVRNA
jgi:hypothetical protein